MDKTYKKQMTELADQCKDPKNRQKILEMADSPVEISNEYCDTLIWDSDMPATCKVAFRKHDPNMTVGDLANLGYWDLRTMYIGLGDKKIELIKKFLADHGLRLKDHDYREETYEASRLVKNQDGLPGRVKTFCKYSNIYTVDELAEKGYNAILRGHCMGIKNAEDTRKYLMNKFGLKMKDYDYSTEDMDQSRVIKNLPATFPGRIKTWCEWYGHIKTVDELAEVSASYLKKQRNVGPRNVELCRQYLQDNFGLDLKD